MSATNPVDSIRPVAWLCVCLVLPVQAQDNFFEPLDVEIEESGAAGSWSLLGWATQKLGYGLEQPGPLFSRSDREINRVETSLFVQFDTSLADSTRFRFSAKAYHDEVYRLQKETPYTAAEINEFRNRFEVRDFYIEHEMNNGLYLKVGNQILSWGMAEYLRVSDLINTEDQYTFGQQDLEDLRLQVPAVLVNYPLGDWSLDGVVTWEAGRNQIAPHKAEFDQFIALGRPGVVFEEPEHQHEVFVRATTRYARGDIQLVAGEFNDNALSGAGVETGAAGEIFLPAFGQNRMRAVAAAANWVGGSWLLFAEAGYESGKALQPQSAANLSPDFDWETRDRILGVLGLEYSGIENLLLSFEIDTIDIPGTPPLTPSRDGRTGYGMRLYWTALNERLEILGVWNDLGDQTGQVGRLSVEYDLSDAFTAGLLWTSYDSDPDSIFYAYRNNDVIELQLRYNFQF